MPNLTGAEIDALVNSSRVTINNSLATQPILDKLSREGYGKEKLNKGLSLIDAMDSSQASKGTSLGSQKQSTLTVISSLETAHASLSLFRVKGNSLFKEDKDVEVWTALKLGERVPKATDTFITFARTSIDNALENSTALEALSGEGYDETRLKAILAEVQQAELDNRTQEGKKGARQGATLSRDEAVAEFTPWWTSFKKTARKLLTADELTAIGL